MTLAYLSAQEAQRRLLLFGFFTEVTLASTLPTEKLEFFLEQIETQIDNWIGYRVAPTEYSEVLCTSDSTLALLSHYPLISVNRLENAPNQLLLSLPLPEKVMTGDCRLIDLQYPYVCAKIVYTAGLAPIPRMFTDIAFGILAKAIGDDLGFDLMTLHQPVRDTESVSLPGGLKKTYRLGSPGKSGESETELDRLMMPLAQYKNQIFTVGSR